jgi:hypothetical protein
MDIKYDELQGADPFLRSRRRFINIFQRTLHWSLSSHRSINPPSYLRYIFYYPPTYVLAF